MAIQDYYLCQNYLSHSNYYNINNHVIVEVRNVLFKILINHFSF